MTLSFSSDLNLGGILYNVNNSNINIGISLLNYSVSYGQFSMGCGIGFIGYANYSFISIYSLYYVTSFLNLSAPNNTAATPDIAGSGIGLIGIGMDLN